MTIGGPVLARIFITPMILRASTHRVQRACASLAMMAVLVACGGGGGTGDEPPMPPPGPPTPPIARGLTNFQAAAIALGQPNLESGGANQGGTTVGPQTLSGPSGMAVTADGALLLADFSNNRVLMFNTVSTSGQSADAVLGQDGFEGHDASVSVDGLSGPTGVAVGQGKMAVVDRNANRVLIYPGIPRPGERLSPTVVIGQQGFTSSDPGCGPGLFSPQAVMITPDTGKLVVVDRLNHRVLIWDEVPRAGVDVPPPRVVLGQQDLTHCMPNDDDQDGVEDRDAGTGRPVATARTLSNPVDVWSDGTQLVVADANNSRVLIWTSFPEDSHQPANIVLGHDSFSNTMVNSENEAEGTVRPTAKTLATPSGVHSDGTSLVVADQGNGRVLVWKAFPSANLQAADVVLGQAGFEESSGDDGPVAPTPNLMQSPSRVLLTPDSLFVSDNSHHRVLVFRR